MYKTQLERVSDSWSRKVGDFERANSGLKAEVNNLRRENKELRGKVRTKGGTKLWQDVHFEKGSLILANLPVELP